MNTGRRHKTPGSETKNGLLLTVIAVHRVSAFSCAVCSSPNSSANSKDEQINICTCNWLLWQQVCLYFASENIKQILQTEIMSSFQGCK